MANVAIGVTVVIAGSTFTGEYTGVEVGDVERAVHDVSHMGTTGGREKIPGALIDYGEVKLTLHGDQDEEPPIALAPGTITITFGPQLGQTNGATLIGTGFVNAYNFQGDLDEPWTQDVTITWDGATDPAWSDGS